MAGEGGADIPGMGHLSKKELTIGATLLLLVIGVAWYRHHKNAASPSTPATDTGVGIDPATGFTSGSPEDLAALQAQAGGAGSGGGGGGGYGGYTGTTAPSPAGGITDNPTWAQNVENYLINTVGNPNDPLWSLTVGNALGKYLTGQAMTSDQVNIVEQGIAFYGLPPQAGNNGYPPNYRTGPILNGGNPPAGGGRTGSGVLTPGNTIYGPWMVQSGQSIQTVAARFGITPAQIQQANPGVTFKPGASLRIPWLVKPGQTLESIAAAFMIPPAQLAAYLGV